MRNVKHFVVPLLAGVMLSGMTMLAQPPSRKTELTVNETILIPGKELVPGKYTMKLMDSVSNRHIVQIFNENNEIQATILAIPNSQMEPKEDTVLTYWETPAGAPRALRAWFYPGETIGQEFAYPKDMAERIAAQNAANRDIPTYDADHDLTVAELGKIEIENEPLPETASSSRAGVASSTTTTAASTTYAAPVPSRDTTMSNSRNDSNSSAMLAQNDSSAYAAQRNARGDYQDANRQMNNSDELPRTASPLPWIIVLGSLAAAAAFVVRTVRVASRS